MNSPDPMGRINQNRNEGPDTVSTDMDKGRYTYDVRKIFGFFDPLLLYDVLYAP